MNFAKNAVACLTLLTFGAGIGITIWSLAIHLPMIVPVVSGILTIILGLFAWGDIKRIFKVSK